MTGTFDNWSKSEKMEKVGDKFEKSVDLPDTSEKIYYKVGHKSPSIACEYPLFLHSIDAPAPAFVLRPPAPSKLSFLSRCIKDRRVWWSTDVPSPMRHPHGTSPTELPRLQLIR